MTKSSSPPHDSSHPDTSPKHTEPSEHAILNQRAETPEEEAELHDLLKKIKRTQPGVSQRMRRVGWLAALLTFVLLGVLTAVLVQEVRLATRMYGPHILAPGSNTSYRISVFDPEKTAFFRNIQGQLWILGQNKKKLLFQGQTKQDVLLANINAPAWPEGEYKLKLLVKCPAGQEEFIRPIKLMQRTKFAGSFAEENNPRVWKFTPQNPGSPYRVELFADNRAPIADLMSMYWLRIQERPALPSPPTSQASASTAPALRAASQPTSQPKARAISSPSASLHRSQAPLNPFAVSPKPTKKKTHPSWSLPRKPLTVWIQHGRTQHAGQNTSSLGFVRFPYVAQMFEEQWTIRVTGSSGTHMFYNSLKPEGYQLVLDVPKVLARPKQNLFLRVDSLHSKGDLHIDLTQNGQHIWSYQTKVNGGRAAISLPLPPHAKGLIGVQVYTEFYFPGEIHDEQLIYVGKPSRKELFAALKQHLTRRGDGAMLYALRDWKRQIPKATPLQKWIKPLLSFFKARFVPPTMFYNSAEDRLRRLRQYQTSFRKKSILFFIGLAGCVVTSIFLWLVVGYRRDQRNMREVAEENDLEVVQTRGLPLLFLFLTLLSAIFATIILLFWVMQWTYDKI